MASNTMTAAARPPNFSLSRDRKGPLKTMKVSVAHPAHFSLSRDRKGADLPEPDTLTSKELAHNGLASARPSDEFLVRLGPCLRGLCAFNRAHLPQPIPLTFNRVAAQRVPPIGAIKINLTLATSELQACRQNAVLISARKRTAAKRKEAAG